MVRLYRSAGGRTPSLTERNGGIRHKKVHKPRRFAVPPAAGPMIPARSGTENRIERTTQRHHPRRGLWHAPSPSHTGDEQAASADLRQTDDLLPAERIDARGHPL